MGSEHGLDECGLATIPGGLKRRDVYSERLEERFYVVVLRTTQDIVILSSCNRTDALASTRQSTGRPMILF